MTWPEAFASAVGAIAFVSLLMGQWPWENIVVIHKRCDCRKRKYEEDEED